MQEILFDEEDEMDDNNNLQRENEELRMNEEWTNITLNIGLYFFDIKT